MMRLSAWLFAAALVVGLGATPTLSFAEDDAPAQTSGDAAPPEDATAGESKIKKMEEEVVKDMEKAGEQPADSLMESEGADD